MSIPTVYVKIGFRIASLLVRFRSKFLPRAVLYAPNIEVSIAFALIHIFIGGYTKVAASKKQLSPSLPNKQLKRPAPNEQPIAKAFLPYG